MEAGNHLFVEYKARPCLTMCLQCTAARPDSLLACHSLLSTLPWFGRYIIFVQVSLNMRHAGN